MTTSLGTASLILAADGKPLTAGLGKASKETQSWAGRQRATVANGVRGIGSGISGGIGKVASAGITGVGIAATTFGLESVTGFVGKAKDRFSEMSKIGDFAKNNNTSVEDATGMFALAKSEGSDYKDFVEGLITTQNRINEAMAGTGEISQLAFQKLGVAAQDFSNKNPADQFYKMMGAINNLANGADKSDLVLKMFGEDTGKNLLPLLGKSEAELRKMGAGFAMTTEEMAKAQVASASLTVAQNAMDRAFDQLLIAMTPVFTLIGDQGVGAMNSLGTSITGFGSQVMPIFKNVTLAIAGMIDVMKFAGGAWDIAQGGIVKAIGAMGSPTLFSPNSKQPRSQMFDELGKEGQDQINEGHAAINKAWNGDTSNKAEAMFLKFENALKMKVDVQARALTPGAFPPSTAVQAPKKPLDAIVEGSQASASAIAGFRNEGVKQADIAKQQLIQQQKTNVILEQIEKGVGNTGLSLKVI